MALDRLPDLPPDNITQYNVSKINAIVATLVELNVYSECITQHSLLHGCFIKIFEMLSFGPNLFIFNSILLYIYPL